MTEAPDRPQNTTTTDDPDRALLPPLGAQPQPADAIRFYRLESPSIGNIIPAFIKAQAEFDPVLKDTENSHLRTRYASLKAVLDATRPHLAKHGLLLLQQPDIGPTGKQELVTRIFHESGEWLAGHYEVLVQTEQKGTTGPQQLGSAFTYARRHCALAMLGLAPGDEDDDDGNAASRGRGNTGDSRAPQQQAHAGNPEQAGKYATEIEQATSRDQLAGIASRIGSDTSLSPAERRSLKDLFDEKSAEVNRPARPARGGQITEQPPAAAQPAPQPPTAAAAPAAPASGPEDVSERTEAPDTPRRKAIYPQTMLAHHNNLHGAGLAIGLLIRGEDDHKYLTVQELDAMRKVTVDAAAEAELDYVASLQEGEQG